MIDAEKSLEEMEAEVLNARGHAMPVLKGTYRAMISTARGYWDPAAKRTRADFGDLSPTKLMQLGVFRETLRPRFQAWFLQDQTRWPGTNEEAASLLKALQADPRWSSWPLSCRNDGKPFTFVDRSRNVGCGVDHNASALFCARGFLWVILSFPR